MGERAFNGYLRMCIGRPLEADISEAGTPKAPPPVFTTYTFS